MAITTTSTNAAQYKGTITYKYRRKFFNMLQSASGFVSHWAEVRDFFMPRRGRSLLGGDDKDDGTKKNQKTINSIAMDAAERLAAMLQTGLTDRTQDWFVLTIADKALSELPAVKNFLVNRKDKILSCLGNSNFYNASYSLLKEYGVVGVGAMFIEKDYHSMIRCRQLTIGEYYISCDSRGRPDTLYRRFSWTAEEVVKEFGDKLGEKSTKKEKVGISQAVLDAFNNGSDQKFVIIHVIQPNDAFNPNIRRGYAKRWESVYFEESGNPDVILDRGGYDEFPGAVVRFDVVGNEPYGDSLGMKTLGDVKQLQKMEEKKLKGIDKEVDPPVNAPPELKGKGTLLSGGVNYVNTTGGAQGVTPVQEVRLDLRNLSAELDRVEDRIEKGMYIDLITAIVNNDTRKTATEIMQQHADRMQILVPAVGRAEMEYLNSVVNRVNGILETFPGYMDPVPPELEGVPIYVQYTSQLSNVQKLTRIKPLAEFMLYVQSAMAIDPMSAYKVNVPEILDKIHDALNLAPNVVRSDEEFQTILEQKRQEALQQQQAMAAINAVQGAKDLAATPMGTDSALDRLVRGGGQ